MFAISTVPAELAMNPAKVKRQAVKKFQDLPNVGPACAGDLEKLGFLEPNDLKGQDAYLMHKQLERLTMTRQDPCVIDVFLSIVHFMNGKPAKPWWHYTEERKKHLAKT